MFLESKKCKVLLDRGQLQDPAPVSWGTALTSLQGALQYLLLFIAENVLDGASIFKTLSDEKEKRTGWSTEVHVLHTSSLVDSKVAHVIQGSRMHF